MFVFLAVTESRYALASDITNMERNQMKLKIVALGLLLLGSIVSVSTVVSAGDWEAPSTSKNGGPH
jgi:hypothetical protein